MSVDVSVVLNLHAEGDLAHPSLRSFQLLVERTRANGVMLEALAVLDDPDPRTREIVEQYAESFDAIHTVSLRDLGQVRNAMVEASSGEYVAFVDGDDLWCEDWLIASFRSARSESQEQIVWHPEFVLFFDPADLAVQSSRSAPSSFASTYVLEQASTTDAAFDRRALLIDNLWTSNVFAPRQLHRSFPYESPDRERGLGIEDWSWNLATVWAGVPHRTVPDTVHMVRMKPEGSLGRANIAGGLLPYLPQGARLLPQQDSGTGMSFD